MNHSLIRLALIGAIVDLCVSPSARSLTIETVAIGNAGNAADVQPQGSFGAVSYEYRIGRTEVTNAQYVEFLNAVDPAGGSPRQFYHPSMTNDARGGINFNAAAASFTKYSVKLGRDLNPVVFVSYFDAIRFVNWLHNGQGSGDTESGAYNGVSAPRNAGALWFLPTENEWYKAAYHKNDGVTGNYWDYPTSSDAVPVSDQPPGGDAPNPSNTANFFAEDVLPNNFNDGYAVTGSSTFDPSQNYLTDVGAYTSSLSPYGTIDQAGNVLEWNETLFPDSSFRGQRGGSWAGGFGMAASDQFSGIPSVQLNAIGFRVATVAIPSGVAGDYNDNGTVDAADYVLWRDSLNQSGAGLAADGNGNNQVDPGDYDVWRTNFGKTATGSAAYLGPGDSPGVDYAVPEPSNVVLLLVLAFVRRAARK